MQATLLSCGIFILIVRTASAAPDCHIDFNYFLFGQDFQSKMVVRSGKPCANNFNIRGGGITSLVVSEPAKHGTAALAGTHRYAYKSNAGYVGPDNFIIRMTGETIGRFVQSGQTNITVDVNVIP